MPRVTTYSFVDTSFVITHPLAGQNQTTGEGIGSMSISMTDDRTQFDLAADGSIMVSKITSGRGTITLEIQQTSALNRWLIQVYNMVDNAPVSAWTQLGINIKELFDNGIKTVASGAAFQKIPDRKNAQNGDKVIWSFLCANITQEAA